MAISRQRVIFFMFGMIDTTWEEAKELATDKAG